MNKKKRIKNKQGRGKAGKNLRKGRKRKHHNLPDLDDDESFPTPMPESLEEENELTTMETVTTECSADDPELEQKLFNGRENTSKKKYKQGDVLWVKHDNKSCYWPAYVKSVQKTKISVFFICYNKFENAERSFSYNVNSKKLKAFSGKENKELMESGQKHLKRNKKPRLNLDAADDDDELEVQTFLEAVDLAETYLLQSQVNAFSDTEDVYEYFRTRGLSLCHRKCVEEHNASFRGLLSPRKHPARHSDHLDAASCATPKRARSLDSLTPVKEPQQNGLRVDDGAADDEATAVTPLPAAADLSDLTKKQKQDVRRTEVAAARLEIFNRANERAVNFIIDGGASQRLRDILSGKWHSERMIEFNKKWANGLDGPQKRRLKVDHMFFERNVHHELVIGWLQKFISKTPQIKLFNLVKKGDLLFHVLLPEATIFAIARVRRKSFREATKVFERGFKHPPGGRFDAALNAPLTQDERRSVEQRIKSLADELSVAHMLPQQFCRL